MDPTRLAPGVCLSGRLLSEEIGEGGFARVFRAEPVGGGASVAIKVAVRPELVSALRSEGAALRRLQGPRFVKILEEHLDEDPPHFVLEHCPGGDLRALLQRSPGSRIPARRVEKLAAAILEGVAIMHEQDLVHGDLKPENILLDEKGAPKIADLGLSRAHRQELIAIENEVQASLPTQPGVRGTPDYLAPEVRKGEPISPRSDVFALGVMLYEMLTGARPVGLIDLPGERAGAQVSRALDRVVARALAPEASSRHADASLMLADLRAGDRGLGLREVTIPTSRREDARFASFGWRFARDVHGVYAAIGGWAVAGTALGAIAGLCVGLALTAILELGKGGALLVPVGLVVGAIGGGSIGFLAGLRRLTRRLGFAPTDPAAGAETFYSWLFQRFTERAAAGDTDAMFSLAVMLSAGQWVPKDEVKALDWYRRAADAGDIDAMFCCGETLILGWDEASDEERTEAVAWFRKAAEGAHVTAMVRLASCLDHGRGVAADPALACSWIRKAAEAGDRTAMLAFGRMLAAGRGCAKDEAAAAAWFERAAELASPEAMLALGEMLEHGRGVEKNEEEAAECYRDAFEHASPDAREQLERLLARRPDLR